MFRKFCMSKRKNLDRSGRGGGIRQARPPLDPLMQALINTSISATQQIRCVLIQEGDLVA